MGLRGDLCVLCGCEFWGPNQRITISQPNRPVGNSFLFNHHNVTQITSPSAKSHGYNRLPGPN
jgi:hypothetical protein